MFYAMKRWETSRTICWDRIICEWNENQTKLLLGHIVEFKLSENGENWKKYIDSEKL